MCRLFGLSAAPQRVHATFWLVEAPDSLVQQSRREPDGTGLGTFTQDGRARVEKQPLAAYADRQFAREAKERVSTTFLAHVRYASTGGLDVRNTHPFSQQGRLMAHNGVIEDIARLEAELGRYRDLIAGDTDSERLFALISKQVDALGGDVGAGIGTAVRWVAAALPIYALNLILATPTELWALRYPDTHELWFLERAAGGSTGDQHLSHGTPARRIRAHSTALADSPAVVVASERMDDDPGWQALRSGELLHVDDHLTLTRRTIIDAPPRHLLSLEELGDASAASQSGT